MQIIACYNMNLIFSNLKTIERKIVGINNMIYF